jgi:NAD(P)-dependent dehydrogenase (short-subunit alcohol dehydrogenase family)
VGVTLVTGASSGIGRSLARRLAAHGDAIAALARRAELLDSLVAEIEAAGGRALAVPCDVTDREGLRKAAERAASVLGPIDRLVANAGGGTPTPGDAFDAGSFEAVVRLNLVGTAYSIEAVLPDMLRRGAGHLVAVSSLAGYRGLPTGAAYCAAKAGVTNLMESLRIDLRPRGIDVTLLLPGFVRVKPGPGKRKKGKPLQLELEDATARMERAILARRARFAFPWPLVAAVGTGRVLPSRVYDRLLSGRGRRFAPGKE